MAGVEIQRCWYCSVEPLDVETITSGDGAVVRVVPVWPPGDHDHAVMPPSPGELLAAGAAAADRSLAGWMK